MEYLRLHYSRLETDELLRLRATELTDDARECLDAELRSRDGTEDAIDSSSRRKEEDVVSVAHSDLAPL